MRVRMNIGNNIGKILEMSPSDAEKAFLDGRAAPVDLDVKTESDDSSQGSQGGGIVDIDTLEKLQSHLKSLNIKGIREFAKEQLDIELGDKLKKPELVEAVVLAFNKTQSDD